MTGLAALTVPLVVAAGTDPTGNQTGGQGQEFGSASPVALLVLIAFFIAVGFLARSMAKHLKRVPASFDEPAESRPTEANSTEPAPDAETSRHAEPAKPDA